MIKQGTEPLITVVVPVYKVEEYLRECIDSILRQSYINLEIILVDDGSPDRCGQICDEYQVQDERIKVIHQQNKGLSGARNSAIDIAQGEYYVFIDSDDWISVNMIEELYKQMILNQADMAVTALESFYEDGSVARNAHGDKIFVYSKVQALDCFLFNDYLTPCVCGKLYKAATWKEIRCPEGKLFEDQYTTYKLIERCEKIVYITAPLYHYRKRGGSIGHGSFNQKTYHLYDAIHEEYNYIREKYSKECPNIVVAKITWEVVFINMMIVAGYYEKNTIKEVRSFARKHINAVFKCGYISKLRKGQISLLVLSYPLYKIFYVRYKRRHPLA